MFVQDGYLFIYLFFIFIHYSFIGQIYILRRSKASESPSIAQHIILKEGNIKTPGSGEGIWRK